MTRALTEKSAPARPDTPPTVKPIVGPTPRETAIRMLAAGLWPVPLYPKGAIIPGRDKPAEGKEPIGKAWGAVRNTLDTIHNAFRRTPKAGVGIALGPGRGPNEEWLIDVEGDGPEAEESRARLYGGEVIETLGWGSVRGGHDTLTVDLDRMAALLPSLKGQEGKGLGAGVYHLPEFPGLEIRVGGAKPDGTIKQPQSAFPPTVGTDDHPRQWNGVSHIAPAPEAFYQALERVRKEMPTTAAPTPGPARHNGRARGQGHETTITREDRLARARKYLDACQPAISGQGGHNRAFKVVSRIGPGFDLTPEETFVLLRDVYNPRCEPPWSEKELRHKVEDAYKREPRRGFLLNVPPERGGTNGRDHGGTFHRARSGPVGRNGKAPNNGEYTPPSNGHASANGNGREYSVAKPDDEPINRTDLGNARRLVHRFGHLIRYYPKWGTWFIWDEKRWREDLTGEIHRLAKRTVRGIGAEAVEAVDDDEAKAILRWALQSESKKHLDAMISLAWSEPGVPVESEQLDRDRWLLNVENGTIDLRTGELRPHRQNDLITKLAPIVYDPDAECPRWEKFLLRIMADNEELIGFLQRAIGYGLTGDTSEHALFFLYGTGRNGKGTFLDTFLSILGDYATTIDADKLTAKRDSEHPTWLTDLDGRRFVTTEEVEDGRQMAEALVKKLTGGNRIKGRRMRENNYEFDPTHTLFLAANHRPEIKGTDEGIWSRIKLVPFEVFIPPEERDRQLKAHLVSGEGPGILAWAVRGCLEWQRDGLKEPEIVKIRTDDYRAEMDKIGGWMAERCNSFLNHPTLRSQARELANALYQDFTEYAKRNGLEIMPGPKFGSELEQRGYTRKPSNGMHYRIGITLKEGPVLAPDRTP